MGENGETIKIGTVVQHPFARPPHFFFYSVPNEDTRRASRDDAMVNKKEGEGETKFHLAHSETAEGSFSTECWVQRKRYTHETADSLAVKGS